MPSLAPSGRPSAPDPEQEIQIHSGLGLGSSSRPQFSSSGLRFSTVSVFARAGPDQRADGQLSFGDASFLGGGPHGAEQDTGVAAAAASKPRYTSVANNMFRQAERRKDREKNARPWFEKHRPKAFSEIVQSATHFKLFADMRRTGKVQHLLLYGPPGCGKTTTAWALLNELFGKKNAPKRVKALNSSQDRGVDVVRNEIKPYCEKPPYCDLDLSALTPDGEVPPFPNLKFVLLDEADAMTFEAQAALRRIIEKDTDATRFILCCNYLGKIIDPIQSRCAVLSCPPLAKEAHKKRLVAVAAKEVGGAQGAVGRAGGEGGRRRTRSGGSRWRRRR